MARKIILVKYGELWLKSEPVRRHFLKRLKGNIKKHLQTAGKRAQMRIVNGRFYIYPEGKFNTEFLSHTFGIVAYAPGVEVNKDTEEIKKAAELFAKPKFKIKARRTDKSFPLRSSEIQRQVGMFLEKKGIPADLQKPEHIIKIEIRDNAYIYAKEQKGPGGLPLATGGIAAAMLRDSDDLLAAWLVMKRGTNCIFIKPNKRLLNVIEKWSIGRKPKIVNSIKNTTAKILIDCRESRGRAGSLIILNPLAGFSAKEKKRLMKRIGRKI